MSTNVTHVKWKPMKRHKSRVLRHYAAHSQRICSFFPVLPVLAYLHNTNDLVLFPLLVCKPRWFTSFERLNTSGMNGKMFAAFLFPIVFLQLTINYYCFTMVNWQWCRYFHIYWDIIFCRAYELNPLKVVFLRDIKFTDSLDSQRRR